MAIDRAPPVVIGSGQTYDSLFMSLRPSDRLTATSPLGPSAAIVVLERVPRWSLVARQLFAGAKLTGLRSLEDVLPTVQMAPHAVLLLEVPRERAPQIVSLLVRLQTEFPHVMPIACVASVSPSWELLLREAGAALVLRSPQRLRQIAPWLRRHLLQAPQPKLSLREHLWSQLPWPDAAATASPGA